jgi:hypothetical protein
MPMVRFTRSGKRRSDHGYGSDNFCDFWRHGRFDMAQTSAVVFDEQAEACLCRLGGKPI